jgi:hypothetical protein
MLLAEYREHEVGSGCRYRVWTQEDANYGSFKIVSKTELVLISEAFHLMGGCCRPAEDAHIDSVNSHDGCPWCYPK